MKKKTLRMGLAGLGAAALTVSSVLMGGLAASAADTQLGPDEIIGFEDGAEGTDGYNFDKWHVGSVTNVNASSTDSLEFGECSITVLAPYDGEQDVTQVMKGYTFRDGVNDRPSSPEEIKDAMLSASIDADADTGTATLQFPFFFITENSDGVEESEWAGTWRTDSSSVTEETTFVSSLGDVDDMTLDEIIETIEQISADDETDIKRVELLGVGFTGSEGTVVNSFSFGGDTFYFGTGECVQEVEEDPADQVDPGETQPTKPQRVETAAL